VLLYPSHLFRVLGFCPILQHTPQPYLKPYHAHGVDRYCVLIQHLRVCCMCSMCSMCQTPGHAQLALRASRMLQRH